MKITIENFELAPSPTKTFLAMNQRFKISELTLLLIIYIALTSYAF